MKRINRGLIGTSEVSPLGRPVDADATAERKIAQLRLDPLKGYQWRETYQWAQRLNLGKSDEKGRRLFSDAGRSDARYVSRITHRAALGKEIPTSERVWSLLRESLARIYTELRGEV